MVKENNGLDRRVSLVMKEEQRDGWDESEVGVRAFI